MKFSPAGISTPSRWLSSAICSALVLAEIGALSERRIALLVDANLSGLPPFLVRDGGINSGFMIAHVTAAALASDNKALSFPSTVDSLPTSANQEDHVSMATNAARRLGEMVENTSTIVAIEAMAAAQGLEFHRPLQKLGGAGGDIRGDSPARRLLRPRPISGAGDRNDEALGLVGAGTPKSESHPAEHGTDTQAAFGLASLGRRVFWE